MQTKTYISVGLYEERGVKGTDLMDWRNAVMFMKSRYPELYSHAPATIVARAATNSTTASGKLAIFPVLGELPGSGTRRAWSNMEEERRESNIASFKCDNRFRSSMQKSLAALPVFGTT
jgi:hypothetical protein